MGIMGERIVLSVTVPIEVCFYRDDVQTDDSWERLKKILLEDKDHAYNTFRDNWDEDSVNDYIERDDVIINVKIENYG